MEMENVSITEMEIVSIWYFFFSLFFLSIMIQLSLLNENPVGEQQFSSRSWIWLDTFSLLFLSAHNRQRCFLHLTTSEWRKIQIFNEMQFDKVFRSHLPTV